MIVLSYGHSFPPNRRQPFVSLLDQGIAIGPFGVRLGVLLLILAAVCAMLTGWALDRRQESRVVDRVLNLLLVSVICARLVFVLRYHQDFEGLLDVLDIRDGAFSIGGGLAGGTVYTLWTIIRHPAGRRPFLKALGVGGLALGLLFAGSTALLGDVDRSLPDVTLQTLDGEPVRLREFASEAGQPLVINIWASWCAPCRREMPMLERAQDENPDITFLFVNYQEGADLIDGYLRVEGLSLERLLMDTQGVMGQTLDFIVLPTTLYYSADGELVDGHVGELRRAGLQRSLDRLEAARRE